MTYLRKIYDHLVWLISPSCEPLARYAFELSRGLVLGTFAYIFFGSKANWSTIIITLTTSFGLMLIGIVLTRIASNKEEPDDGNTQ